jgi:hypothetical protein
MSWKIFPVVCFSAALAIPQLAAAAESKAPDAAALGQFESILDSCSQANPKSAPDYKKQREKLVHGVSDEDLAKVRGADEYKNAYKEISDRFDKASKDEAVEACKIFLGTAESSAKGAQKDTKKDTHK